MATRNPLLRMADAVRRIATLVVVLALALPSPLHAIAHQGASAGPVASAQAGMSLAIPGTDFVLPWCAPGAMGNQTAAPAQPDATPAAPAPAKPDPCIAHCLAALNAVLPPLPAVALPARHALSTAAPVLVRAAPSARPAVAFGAGPRSPPV